MYELSRVKNLNFRHKKAFKIVEALGYQGLDTESTLGENCILKEYNLVYGGIKIIDKIGNFCVVYGAFRKNKTLKTKGIFSLTKQF